MLLIERLSGKYSGEGVKISVEFDDLILHSRPEIVEGRDLKKTFAGILRRYLSLKTCTTLLANVNTKVGDFTVTLDELNKCYSFIMDVDLIVRLEGDGKTTEQKAVIPAIVFQLYDGFDLKKVPEENL